LLKLSEFSSALTDVLASLDKKVNTLDSGGSKVLSLAEQVQQHDDSIKDIENNQLEQKEAFEEAINAHATMGKAVMQATTSQCGELQNELVELRSMTKKELSSLQGVLEASLKESIMHLTDYMQPSAPQDLPELNNSLSTQEVMTIMLGRVERLEKKSQSLELANQLLKDSIETDGKAQDRFDELTNRVVQSERKCERQEKKINEFEKRLAILANSQSRSLKMINVISQKVNAISTIAWDKTSEDGSKVQAVSFNSIVEKETPTHFVNDNALIAIDVFKEALLQSEKSPEEEEGLGELVKKPKVNGPKVTERKTILKDQAHMAKIQHLRDKRDKSMLEINETKQSSPPPTPKQMPVFVDNSTMTLFEEDDNGSLVTLDSSVMMEEYVIDKLNTLEKKVDELIDTKLDKIAMIERENAGHLQDVQESLHEVEMHVEDMKGGADGGGVSSKTIEASTNPVVIRENAFRLLIRDTKASWDLAFTELDKKVNKMDAVIKQLDTQPDEVHRRLSAFRDKVTHALEVISVALPESREDIITAIYDTMEDVRQDALQVVVMEEEIRHNVQNKSPGETSAVSQMPTHLPELLQEACGKTVEILGEKIEKYDLSSRIDELSTLILSKVDIPIFIKMEEDLRIALTLKADQKQMENALDKKTSVTDMQKFREYVTDEIDAMRAMLATSTQRMPTVTANYQQSSGQSSAELEALANALSQRMDRLFKNMQENNSKLGGFVPRQEIETALQALLNEVKAVKNACVDKDALEEKLMFKADEAKVERLLAALEGTVGDPISTHSAAIQKCLVCDKPVNPFQQQSTTRPNSPTSYFDKPTSSSANSPTKQRPLSSRPYPEKLRQTAEMNILRNSMESLPALDDSRLGVNGNGGSINSARGSSSRGNMLSAHSRRIRSAAGGGLGPSYAQDSR